MIGDPQEEGEIVGSKSCNQEEDGGERGGGGGGGGGREVDCALSFSMWVGPVGGKKGSFLWGRKEQKNAGKGSTDAEANFAHMCVRQGASCKELKY